MRSDIRGECGPCGWASQAYSRAALGVDPTGTMTGLPGVWLNSAAERASSSPSSAVRKRGPKLRGGVRSPNREPRWSAERRACSAEHAAASARCRHWLDAPLGAPLPVLSSVRILAMASRRLARASARAARSLTYRSRLCLAVLQNLHLLDGDETARHHAVEHGQEGIDLLLRVHDFDDDRQIL